MTSGHHGSHERPALLRNDLQLSLQLPHPLVHTPDSHSKGTHPVLSTLLQKGLIEALATILNLEDGIPIIGAQANFSGFTFRMSMDISKTLLQNTKHRQLGFR